jgi:sec-independent protein translocase protein TatC
MATEAASLPDTPDEFRMTLSQHLGELRSRLLRVTLSVLVLGGAALVWAKELYGILMRPVLQALPPDSGSLVYTSAIEEINVYMKVGMYAGVFLATPVVLWQIWGFVAPGLYDDEKKLAGPFIVFGTLSFLAGAVFCYQLLLPQMFTFLLREENAVALEGRLNTGKLREEDAVRLLRLGEVTRAGALAKLATAELEASGEGQAKDTAGDFGVKLNPRESTDALARLEGLGRLVDALRDGMGKENAPVLTQVVALRIEAADLFGARKFDQVFKKADEAAQLLATVLPNHQEDLLALWRLEKDMGSGNASYESANWTRPMLSMSEQLTLVLVLELAFGIIFELPLVMAVLGMVGLVKSSFLFKYQRHAFVVCLIAAAIITPTGDAVNLALMAGPMLLCYELGVVLVWLVEKRRNKNAPSERASGG